MCMYEMFERGCVRAGLLWSLCGDVFPLHSDGPLSSNCLGTHFVPYLFVVSLSSYMVMPFVAQDLGHIMKKRRLTDRIITYLFYQLLRGLKVRLLFFILKNYKKRHFCNKKKSKSYTCFVELSTEVIPNPSKIVQSQRNLSFDFRSVVIIVVILLPTSLLL